MSAIDLIANASASVFALAAAWYWYRVGSSKIEVPEHVPMAADGTNFDWLTIPIKKQADQNKTAAYCAGVSAFCAAIHFVIETIQKFIC